MLIVGAGATGICTLLCTMLKHPKCIIVSPLEMLSVRIFPQDIFFVLLQIYKIILSDGNALPIFLQEIAYPKAKGHVYEV